MENEFLMIHVFPSVGSSSSCSNFLGAAQVQGLMSANCLLHINLWSHVTKYRSRVNFFCEILYRNNQSNVIFCKELLGVHTCSRHFTIACTEIR
jgi:hypothetical protein